jgi:hypothetical protein
LTIKEHYPDLVKKYEILYRGGYQPEGGYQKKLYHILKQICKKYAISQHLPRYIPDIPLKKNIETSTILFLISYYLGFNGERYKSESFRKLAQLIEDMDDDIETLNKEGRLNEIKGMGKNPNEVIKEYLETGKSSYLEELKK